MRTGGVVVGLSVVGVRCVCVDAISDVHVCACVLCVFIDSLLIRMEIFNNAEHNSTLNRVLLLLLLLGSADGRLVWWWHVYRARACVRSLRH